MPTDPIADSSLLLPPERPLFLNDLALPAPLVIVVLAPHPDDFDAIGVALRHLQRQGHLIHVAVMTTGVNGVEDGWNGARSAGEKAELREAEKRASCEYIGLPAERLTFLRLCGGCDADSYDFRLRDYLLARRAQLSFLPHKIVCNGTHRRTYH